MFKKTLLLFISLLMCLTAGARTVIRSHEDFVHMPEYQKNQHVIKLMELMVELEGKYIHETKKYGYNQERFEKFQKVVEKITSELLISSAYARSTRPQKSWSDLAREFTTNINTNQERCIYAGWVSKMGKAADPNETKKVCKHPSDLSISDNEKRVYPDDNAGCPANDTSKIQCNPVIFGYKKVDTKTNKGTLFCVSTENRAENSSYLCMKAALGQSQNSIDVDSTEVRLGYLRGQLTSNPSAFDGVQKYVYKTCVCPKPASSNLSTQYHEYMRPHQTCYGLMNMIGETVNCQDPKLPIDDTSIFSSLREYMSSKTINSGIDAGAFYQTYINNEVIKKSTQTFNNLCGTSHQPEVIPEDVKPKDDIPVIPDTEPKKYVCKQVICDPKPATENTEGNTAASFSCTYEASEEGKTELATWSKIPTELPAKAEDKTISISGEIDNKPVALADCPLTINAPSEENKTEEEKDFEVKIKKIEEKTVTVIAEIKLKGEVVELGTSKWEWTIKDVPADVKVKKDWEEVKKDEGTIQGRGGDSEDNEITDEKTPSTPPAKLEIIQERISKVYKVCGKLDAKAEKCVDIPALEEKKEAATTTPAATGATVPGGMPQAPIRGAADTSAIGIR